MTHCFFLVQVSSLYPFWGKAVQVLSMQLFKHSSLEFKTSQAKSHRRNALQMWSVPLSNSVRTKCQWKVGILSRLLLWLAFCPSQFLVGILSGPSQHVLAFCQNHEKCRHLSECEWGFVRSVDFLPYRQKANLAKSHSWAFIWSPLSQLKMFWGWY